MKRFLIFVFLLTGCDGTVTKIDGKSKEAMQASIVALTKSMTPDEKEQFSKDCMAVAIGGEGLAALAAGPEMMAAKLDGMTVAEIRDRAAEVRAKSKADIDAARAESKKRTEENLKKAAELQAEIDRQKKAFEAAQVDASIQKGVAGLRLQIANYDLAQLEAVRKSVENTPTENETEKRAKDASIQVIDEAIAKAKK